MPAPLNSQIAKNVTAIKARIAAACARSGRAESEVRLVAVTKYASEPVVRALVEAGCHDLGEARPQALWDRAGWFAEATPPVTWHLIGHLQRNKVARTLLHVGLLHSLDSLPLIDAVAQSAAELKLPRVRALLEVNISADPSKHGFAPEMVAAALEHAARSSEHLEIVGLMGMSGRDATPATARQQFAALRVLRDECQQHFAGKLKLAELSMGMSDDFEIAVEEGSTMVRIGSALYEGVDQA